jgi:transcription elongation factor GreA
MLVSISKSMIDIKKRLEEEIRGLDYELKVQLPKEIQRAREYGDLRENAEYKAAKERQTFLQARIGQLHRRLAALSLVNLDKIPPEEADPAQGRISPSSPIGKCLLNHEQGDVVEVKVPSGTREYEIMSLVTIFDQVKDSAAEV